MTKQVEPLKVVIPKLRVLPGADDGWEFLEVSAPSSTRLDQDFADAECLWLLSDRDDPGDMKISEVIDFVGQAFEAPRLRFLVKVAFAHLVAKNALEDPYFKCQDYRTRIDENLSSVWELAQDIYEHNRQFQQQVIPPVYHPARPQSTVGLGFPIGRSTRPAAHCSSGDHLAPFAVGRVCETDGED